MSVTANSLIVLVEVRGENEATTHLLKAGVAFKAITEALATIIKSQAEMRKSLRNHDQ